VARVERRERLGRLGQREDVRDEGIDGDLSGCQQPDSFLEVASLVHTRAYERELAPEDPEEVDRWRCGVDRHYDYPAVRRHRMADRADTNM